MAQTTINNTPKTPLAASSSEKATTSPQTSQRIEQGSSLASPSPASPKTSQKTDQGSSPASPSPASPMSSVSTLRLTPQTHPKQLHPAAPGDVVGSYVIQKELGRGQFAVVYLALRIKKGEGEVGNDDDDDDDAAIDALNSGKQFAIKIDLVPEAKLGSAQRKLDDQSMANWKQVLQPLPENTQAKKNASVVNTNKHIIVVEETGLYTAWGHRCAVLEYFKAGDMKTLLKHTLAKHKGFGLPEKNVRAIVYQVLQAVAACHRHNVCHRDIKPANILHNGLGIVKLCDFGLSTRQEPGELTRTAGGSPAYLPREALSPDTMPRVQQPSSPSEGSSPTGRSPQHTSFALRRDLPQQHPSGKPAAEATAANEGAKKRDHPQQTRGSESPPLPPTPSPDDEAPPQGYDAKAADVWAVGVTMFQLLVGRRPFEGDSIPQLVAAIRRGVYTIPPPLRAALSNDATEVLAGLLDRNPKHRFTAEDALNHNWFLPR